MYVRHLNGRGENQQKSAAKSKGDPPGVSRVLFALHIVHHSNYNVPSTNFYD
jgi:hypothetical protein